MVARDKTDDHQIEHALMPAEWDSQRRGCHVEVCTFLLVDAVLRPVSRVQQVAVDERLFQRVERMGLDRMQAPPVRCPQRFDLPEERAIFAPCRAQRVQRAVQRFSHQRVREISDQGAFRLRTGLDPDVAFRVEAHGTIVGIARPNLVVRSPKPQHREIVQNGRPAGTQELRRLEVGR